MNDTSHTHWESVSARTARWRPVRKVGHYRAHREYRHLSQCSHRKRTVAEMTLPERSRVCRGPIPDVPLALMSAFRGEADMPSWSGHVCK